MIFFHNLVKLFVWAALLMGVLQVELWSGTSPVDSKFHNKKVYQIGLRDEFPIIDGRIDEAAWNAAPWGDNFSQKTPYEGAKPSQATAFKILYDNKNLYVAIRAYDKEVKKIVSRMTRRDQKDGDWVEIILDSYFDQRTGFAFAVNAAGVKSDILISGDGNNWDDGWDPIWYVKTSIDSAGWVAEMSIPLSQLRFSQKDNHTWGLHVARYLYRKQEICEWNLIPRKASGWVSLFGQLSGLLGLKPKRPIELQPYTTTNLQFFEKETGNPFDSGTSRQVTGGLDGKIGITNDLTLDFTINPDFGQVEADPSEVNLSAFETFFPEKRPFFIEGRNILDYPISGGGGPLAQDSLFYSRRIGRRPQYEPELEENQYLDMPENTSILAALKLTGKTRNGWSIGVMESVTAKESARIDLVNLRSNMTVEPAANYFVLRLHKDYNKGNTGIGTIFTSTHRNLLNISYLKDLHRSAYTTGFDFFHYWKKKQWLISFTSVFSHVMGDKAAILKTQESSLRYFQRPDADYVTLDPNRTSLSGYGGDFAFGKVGGGRLKVMLGLVWRSPGLELNDVGYIRSADKIMQWFWIGYHITEPFGIFRDINININQYQMRNFGGDRVYDGSNINGTIEFKNYWTLDGGVGGERGGLADDALRGGPSLKLPGAWHQWLEIRSDTRKKLYYKCGNENAWDKIDNLRRKRFWGGVTYKPFNALSITIDPSYTENTMNLQYIDTLDVADQKRYIFARIHQRTLDVTFRFNYSITPDFSIQYYGQPFISTGNYNQFKYITQPRAEAYNDRFHTYTKDEIAYDGKDLIYAANEDSGLSYQWEDPNFKFLQFRSNLVIRWEYSPGSTLYLVWSQGRTEEFSQNIRFSTFRSMRDLFQVHPHDIFLLKFTYRFKI
jgi:Domain of unknown function (DUF5916)/Carbohydrate family 9 binding domain-like